MGNASHKANKTKPTIAYKRKQGTLYLGDSMSLLAEAPITKLRGQVQMVFTSPPFPLNRKKKYGNLVSVGAENQPVIGG